MQVITFTGVVCTKIMHRQKPCLWYSRLQVITYLYRCCLYKKHAFDTEHCRWSLVQVLSVQKSCTDKNHAFDTVYCRWSLTCTGVVCTKNMLLIQSIAGDHLYRCCLYKNHAQTKIMPLILCIAGDHLLVQVLSVQNHAFGTGYCRGPFVRVLSIQNSCFWYRALQWTTFTCVVWTKIMLLIQSTADDHLYRCCLSKNHTFNISHCRWSLVQVLSVQNHAFYTEHCRWSLVQGLSVQNHAYGTGYCRWPFVQVLSIQNSCFWYRALQLTTCTSVVWSNIILLIQSIAGDHSYRCYLYKNHALGTWYCRWQLVQVLSTKIMLLILSIAGDHLYRCWLYKIHAFGTCIAGDYLYMCCPYKNHAFGTGHCRWPLVQVLSEQKSCFWYRSLQVTTCAGVVCTRIMLLVQVIAGDLLHSCCPYKNHAFDTGYCRWSVL